MNLVSTLCGKSDTKRKFPWPSRVYAVRHFGGDSAAGGDTIEFEGIDAEWFDGIGSALPDAQSFRFGRVYLIEIPLRTLQTAKQAFMEGLGGWMHLKLSRPSNRNEDTATVRERLDGEGGWRQRFEFLHLETKRREQLARYFRLPETWDGDPEIELERFCTLQNPHVVAYDVGQGASAGIHHPRGWVVMYFDLGCGVNQHARSFPAHQRFCFGQTPVIVLSHWHSDHWAAAALHDNRALDKTWIVPRQEIGPFAMALCMGVWSNGGKIVVWPNRISITRSGPISIGRCTGRDQNHSGLAMLVKVADGEVLLTADCGYDRLPAFWQSQPIVRGLTAPHHGGNSISDNDASFPRPAMPSSQLAYSSGVNNQWGHPTTENCAAHAARGWKNSRETRRRRPALGNVLLTSKMFFPPCIRLGLPNACTLCPNQ